MDNEYIDLQECEEQGSHLTDCDEDGYCNRCGCQESTGELVSSQEEGQDDESNGS